MSEIIDSPSNANMSTYLEGQLDNASVVEADEDNNVEVNCPTGF